MSYPMMPSTMNATFTAMMPANAAHPSISIPISYADRLSDFLRPTDFLTFSNSLTEFL